MPGAPKELAALSLEQLGQLGIAPSGNGTGMQLSGGACLPVRSNAALQVCQAQACSAVRLPLHVFKQRGRTVLAGAKG